MIFSKKYDNGLRLVVNKMDGMLSVSTGILVGAGSCLETDVENGISHFIEHVNFKGTKRFSSFELSDAFDCIGSQVNAYTSKDMTCYYVKSTVDALGRSFELLSDLFLNSVYDGTELEREKGVVAEEINMSSDTPEDVCLDKLSEAYFGNNGLGLTILGPVENVRRFTREDILSYKDKYYNADNIVISFAGKIEPRFAEELVEKYVLPYISDKKSAGKSDGYVANKCGTLFVEKDIEQVHIALGYEGVRFDDDLSDVVSLANIIIGMGMSSRLFQRVREQLGLCYTVYSFPSGYTNNGTVAVYSAVNPDKTVAAYEAISEVLEDAKRNGITQSEFERGKAQVTSSFAFGEESTTSQMILYGKYLLFTDKIFSAENKLAAISSLAIGDVNDYLANFCLSDFSLAVVGKKVSSLKLR